MNSESDENSESTLFDKVGGEDGIRRLVGDFYDSVFADQKLAHFFRGVPVEKLRRMQIELFTSALDGPVTYGGRSLSHAHHGLGIGPHDMKRFVDHLFETLNGFEISDQDRNEIISRINKMADEIMGEGGLDA